MDREKIIKEWEAVLSRDPLDAPWDLIDETLALLKEQKANTPSAGEIAEEMVNYICEHEKVVRCKDCKHNARCEIAFGCNGNREWFCADGERAEQENGHN